MRRPPTRRRAMALAVAAAGVARSAGAAPAPAKTAWPRRPVRLIVPSPLGQSADIVARLMADKLGEVWKQEVVVENRGGGGGISATEYGKAAPPDGYTLMVVSSGTFGVNPGLYPDLPYRPLVDFLPITNIFLAPLVIVAHPSLPAATLAALIALARKEPGRLSYASPGEGTPQHLAMEFFKLRADIDIVHVPDKGSVSAMADLLDGRVNLMMASATSALGAIADKRVKALAVTTAHRAEPPLDDIPTVADTLPGFDAAVWSGLAAPAGTPLEIVAKVNKDVQALLRDAAVVRQIEQRAALPAPGSPIQFAEFIKKQMDTWGEMVRATGIKPGT